MWRKNASCHLGISGDSSFFFSFNFDNNHKPQQKHHLFYSYFIPPSVCPRNRGVTGGCLPPLRGECTTFGSRACDEGNNLPSVTWHNEMWKRCLDGWLRGQWPWWLQHLVCWWMLGAPAFETSRGVVWRIGVWVGKRPQLKPRSTSFVTPAPLRNILEQLLPRRFVWNFQLVVFLPDFTPKSSSSCKAKKNNEKSTSVRRSIVLQGVGQKTFWKPRWNFQGAIGWAKPE